MIKNYTFLFTRVCFFSSFLVLSVLIIMYVLYIIVKIQEELALHVKNVQNI